MVTTQESLDPSGVAHPVEVSPPAAPAADPSLLGLPTFIVGSLALGLALTGFLPATAAGGVLPIIFSSTVLGLLLTTIWAISVGQTAVAAIFGLFTGFWLSYVALLLGLTHGWYAIAAADVKDTVGTFLLCWTIIVAVLTVAMLRLPAAFTLLLGLVTLALAFVTLGTFNTQPNLSKLGGYVVLAFALVGVYLFLSASAVTLGGKGYPLGRALQR